MSTPVNPGDSLRQDIQNYPNIALPGNPTLPPVTMVQAVRTPSRACTINFYVPGKTIPIGSVIQMSTDVVPVLIPFDSDPDPRTNGGRATQIQVQNRGGILVTMDLVYS